MCFSATASFVAGGVLVGTGVLALSHVKDRRLLPYAFIPVFFGVQQLIEGVQWLTTKPGLLSTILGYSFLFFAFLWWPSFIPYATWSMETSPNRRKILRVVFGVGLALSAYLLLALFMNTLTVTRLGNSICYNTDAPFTAASVAVYVAVVCGAGLLSTRPLTKLFGGLTLVGFTVAMLAFYETFTSVWCFFAAALSIIVVLDIKSRQEPICPLR